MYSLRKINKQDALLKQDRRVFHTADLAVLWKIDNKNTLLTTIKRYIKSEILYRIHKGLYSVIPLNKLHPFELGCAVMGPLSYVSTETILQNSGLIMQHVSQITLLGSKSKIYNINNTTYLCRYLAPQYLVNRTGINDQTRYATASLNRATADLEHLNPKYYLDNPKAIDQNKLKQIKQSVGYK
jgi:predicted transcriptional regulator of viral defense system